MKIFFVQFFCVFLPSLLNLLLLGPYHSVLYRAHLCMKCSLGISDFLEEISSLSHSVFFLYFFALIAEEGFLISSCILRNSAFRCLYLSFSPLLFASLLFTAICKASPDSHFAFFALKKNNLLFEITPERMKGWSQSKNNTQLWM